VYSFYFPVSQALTYEGSPAVRQAAAVAIGACQVVLQDELHLFALLGNLPEDKKNLLTYYFDRHGSRGIAGISGGTPANGLLGNKRAGSQAVETELRHLDVRTSTPVKSAD